MIGTVSIGHKGQSIHSLFDTNEREALATESWGELYKKAQAHHIPYYVAAAVIVHNGTDYRCNLYDGVSLHKLLKVRDLNTPDPLTQLPIQKVHYIFFKCTKYTYLEDHVPTFPLSTPHFLNSQEDSCLQNLIEDDKYSDFFFDSLNLHTAESGSKEEIGRLAQTQFVIGSKLIADGNHLQGLRWIWGAAHKGISAAQKLLGLYAINGEDKGIARDFDEGEKWLKKAARQGDQEAALLLNRLHEGSDQESADSDSECENW